MVSKAGMLRAGLRIEWGKECDEDQNEVEGLRGLSCPPRNLLGVDDCVAARGGCWEHVSMSWQTLAMGRDEDMREMDVRASKRTRETWAGHHGGSETLSSVQAACRGSDAAEAASSTGVKAHHVRCAEECQSSSSLAAESEEHRW